MKKAAFTTLGCKVNFYETEALKALLEKEGYILTDFSDTADIYVINTCTVTHLSDRKSRQLVRRAKRRAPQSLVVVTGCYAQVSPEDLSSLPEVDIMIGTSQRHQLPRLIEQAKMEGKINVVHPVEGATEFERLTYRANRSRTRAFLKVQEGCTQHCSYCIVPQARGPDRSSPLPDVLAEVEQIAAEGYREIVLTGIRLGLYRDDKAGVDLSGLVREIEKYPAIERIRLSSIEPTDFNEDLIQVMADSSKICHHLHIPLQSGSDYILEKMNRPYRKKHYLELVNKLSEKMPELALGSDIMVGFPGETYEHHRQSYEFIQRIAFSRLHVFRYSPRPHTPASEMKGHVDPRIKEERWQEINELGKNLAHYYRQKFMGRKVKILAERASDEDDYLEGFTEHYLRVRAETKDKPSQWLGQLVWVEVKNAVEETLQGIFLSHA